ncbi:MAG TPA: hypothetical protein G4O20_04070 [Dehalococcoidia bacterium]|nr:hypothetical protein [Dehalococcoidia bacterium]
MMRDRSLSMLLMVLFGISGIFILAFVWLQPMSGMERALSTILGAIGLGIALSRIPQLKLSKEGTETEKVAVEAETGD